MLISLTPKINIITMINTNELMLGNLVEYKGEYAIITEIIKDRVALSICGSYINPTDINPIELTDDVVKKLGFVPSFRKSVHGLQNYATICGITPIDITPLITPKPILTTHDGVDMFDKNAEVWVCYKRGMNEFDSKDNPACDTVARQIINPFRDELLLFSSKSSCQAYIDQKWAETHPEPIFLTEDGVKVFEGDKYWFCRKGGFDEENMKSEPYNHIATKEKQRNEDFIRFSTHELTQAYLEKTWAKADADKLENQYQTLLKNTQPK